MNFKITHLVVFTILALSCSVTEGQELARKNGGYETTHTESFDASAKSRLLVSDISGEAVVEGWDREQVQIRERIFLRVITEQEAHEMLSRLKSDYEARGSTIRITGEGEWHRTERHLEIMVPRRFDVDVDADNCDIQGANISGVVDLKTGQGDITVSELGGDATLHSASGDLNISSISGQLEAYTSGGDIDIRRTQKRVRANTAGGNIRVEEAAEDIVLQTSGGRITLRNISGDATAQTSGGDIRADRCNGEVELQTSGGDIVMRDIAGRSAAQTSGGDIYGDNLRIFVAAQTSGGDIELSRIDGAVEASTSAGDIEVEMRISNFDGDHHALIETNSGSIVFMIPEKLPASVTAIIELEDIRWHRFEIHSDFPLRIEEDRRRVIMSGDINGGGPRLHLQARHGDIEIRQIR